MESFQISIWSGYRCRIVCRHWFICPCTRLIIEGNGAQLNCSSGDYGSGCIGRMGPLLDLFAKKIGVIVKIDPITEELERGPDGLCIRVQPLPQRLANFRLAMEDMVNYCF